MGRLFWKFLVAYWAALLAAVLCVVAAAWMYQVSRDVESPVDLGGRARFRVGSGAATLREGGLPALRALMEEWGRQREVLLFAVDGAGQELLGRPIPAEAFQHARELVDTDEGSEVAQQVTLASGETYLLFVPFRDKPLSQRLLFASQHMSPLVLLFAGAVTSLIFGALLAWYVARPIRHLRQAFADLSVGHLGTRVAPQIGARRDEVADLGRQFDEMAEQLQALIAAQQALLHDVSHELRSPLARLQAAIGLARQNPRKLDGSLERIEHEAVRLDDLVGHLLTFSRLGARASEESLGPSEHTDIADLVGSIAEDAHFEAQATQRGVSFSGEAGLCANVRVELLHRAVENVVRNAVKFTDEGSTVEVAATRGSSGKEAVVSVSDHGPGVGESDLEAIFEPFYRGRQGQPGGGFGLGLAIARRAVQAHGGHVVARNRAEGGLEIEMRLPLNGSVAASAPSAEGDGEPYGPVSG